MMLFFTLVFITYFLANLLKGNLFYNFTKEMGFEEIKRSEKGLKDMGESLPKILAVLFLIILPLIVTEIIYLINAFDVDTLKYPTILMTLILILTSVMAKTKKNDLTTEEGREKYRESLYRLKKRTVKSTITNFLWLGYFSYMFYVLVF